MTATSPCLRHDVDDLILEQIHTFKEPARLTDSEIFEYHLRHRQILELYRELDSIQIR